jgi:hypothetical protein
MVAIPVNVAATSMAFDMIFSRFSELATSDYR